MLERRAKSRRFLPVIPEDPWGREGKQRDCSLEIRSQEKTGSRCRYWPINVALLENHTMSSRWPVACAGGADQNESRDWKRKWRVENNPSVMCRKAKHIDSRARSRTTLRSHALRKSGGLPSEGGCLGSWYMVGWRE